VRIDRHERSAKRWRATDEMGFGGVDLTDGGLAGRFGVRERVAMMSRQAPTAGEAEGN